MTHTVRVGVVGLVGLVGVWLFVVSGLLFAQDSQDSQDAQDAQDQAPAQAAKYAGRTHIKIDHEALKNMTREERRAYMQDYKRRRAEEARQAGIPLPTGRQTISLPTPQQVPQKAVAKVAGTNITYDTGTVVGTTGIASQMVGNRFDTALNVNTGMCCAPVEMSGSITMITFNMVNTFFSSAVWSLYSNISGTMAAQVTSMGRGIMTGLNTLNVMSPTTANTYMNGAFLAGIWQFDPTMTGLGVDSGTTGGQGFHAISLNDGMVGSMLTTIMSRNAVFRVSGNVATPVELMDFQVK